MNSKVQKKINLIFHIGNGKTATSFLQKCLEDSGFPGYIGKTMSGQFRYPDFQKIHQELFKTYRGENINSYPNPTRNSHDLIYKYAFAIRNFITQNKNCKTFIISDECIGNYTHFLGELNVFLVIAIGNIICKELGNKALVKKVLSITCRNQVDLIQSIIGYEYTLPRMKISDNLVKKMLSDPSSSYIGDLFFAKKYNLYKQINHEWMINIVPYEVLSLERNPKKYLSKVYLLDNEQMKYFPDKLLQQKVNKNSESINNQNFPILRTKGILHRIGFSLTSQNDHSLRIVIRKRDLFGIFNYGFWWVIGKVLEKSLIRFTLFPSKKYVKLSKQCQQLIKGEFRQDNIELQKILKEYDLKKFNYI